jgi:hypothetical protein
MMESSMPTLQTPDAQSQRLEALREALMIHTQEILAEPQYRALTKDQKLKACSVAERDAGADLLHAIDALRAELDRQVRLASIPA